MQAGIQFLGLLQITVAETQKNRPLSRTGQRGKAKAKGKSPVPGTLPAGWHLCPGSALAGCEVRQRKGQETPWALGCSSGLSGLAHSGVRTAGPHTWPWDRWRGGCHTVVPCSQQCGLHLASTRRTFPAWVPTTAPSSGPSSSAPGSVKCMQFPDPGKVGAQGTVPSPRTRLLASGAGYGKYGDFLRVLLP